MTYDSWELGSPMVIGTLDEFLANFAITQSDWEKAGLIWPELQEIGLDHQSRAGDLRNSAEYFAKMIQDIDRIHSVRWRIKDPNHLMEKIFRKRYAGAEKYKGIKLENYRVVVTDLIGVRALHLFKSDAVNIHNQLANLWNFVEDPIAYIRAGDGGSWLDQLTSAGIKTEDHPDKYRSVHYVLQSSPKKEVVYAEVQVRTIFEEGWSEVDHIVRYPRISDESLVKGYLDTFNRLAGSADEMADFVVGLAASVKSFHEERRQYQIQLDASQQRIDGLIVEIEKSDKQNIKYKELIGGLKSELTQLRGVASQANWHNLTKPGYLFSGADSVVSPSSLDRSARWLASHSDAIEAARRAALAHGPLTVGQFNGAAVFPPERHTGPIGPGGEQETRGGAKEKPEK
jgi:putative GTP pyrophosphokinase